MDDAASCRALIDTAQFRKEHNRFPKRYIKPYSTHISNVGGIWNIHISYENIFISFTFFTVRNILYACEVNLIIIWGILTVFMGMVRSG